MSILGKPETPKESDQGISLLSSSGPRSVLLVKRKAVDGDDVAEQLELRGIKTLHTKYSACFNKFARTTTQKPKAAGKKGGQMSGDDALVSMPNPANLPRLLRREALKPKRPVPRSPNKPRPRRSGWASIRGDGRACKYGEGNGS